MCGLIGVVGTDDSAYEAFVGLLNLQHRGQDGAGILTVDTNRRQFNIQKGSGLVENVFSERSFRSLKGPASIGHARYATIGSRDPNLLQPFVDNKAEIAIGHNGNIVNCYQLKEELIAADPLIHFGSESDSEVILQVLASCLKGRSADKEDAFFSAVESLMSKLVGSYSVVGLTKNSTLFGFRDPHGIRPLYLGKKTSSTGTSIYALSSETVALDYLGYTEREEIEPGQAICISATGQVSRKSFKQEVYSPCMFEWVYFARVGSEIGSVPVYKARFNLGLILAQEIKKRGIKADVVLPIPETSRVAAVAIAEALGIPFRELLIKNRYVNRTFILDDQTARQEAIKRKLFPIAEEIKGKRCLVVDDSIVRGNTAQQIVKLIRQAGAADITLVSTCPPIANPCYYGIDFPSTAELIASGCSEEEVAKQLDADRVVYQSVEGLREALEQKSLCTGCLTGSYPTDISCGSQFEEQRKADRLKQLSETTN